MTKLIVIVYSYFFYESGCQAGDGSGGIFFYQMEVPEFISENELKTMIDSTNQKIVDPNISFEGILEEEMYMHYNICSNIGYSCCSGYTRFKDFLFTKENLPLREVVEDHYYYNEACNPCIYSYDQALKECLSMDDIKDINPCDY